MKTETISYGGRAYEFFEGSEGLAIPEGELRELPKGLLLVLLFLSKVSLNLELDTFMRVFHATKLWVDREVGGLSLVGTQEWGNDAEVVAMASSGIIVGKD